MGKNVVTLVTTFTCLDSDGKNTLRQVRCSKLMELPLSPSPSTQYVSMLGGRDQLIGPNVLCNLETGQNIMKFVLDEPFYYVHNENEPNFDPNTQTEFERLASKEGWAIEQILPY